MTSKGHCGLRLSLFFSLGSVCGVASGWWWGRVGGGGGVGGVGGGGGGREVGGREHSFELHYGIFRFVMAYSQTWIQLHELSGDD